jgi:hypothetical protein
MKVSTILATLAVLQAAAAPIASAADEPTAESLVPCPYTPAEIKQSLGLDVEPGIVSDMRSDEVRDVGCLYPVKNSFIALTVRQIWDIHETSEPSPSNAPGFRAVAGDADGAAWAEDKAPDSKKEKPHLKLTYKRGKVKTAVDLYGSYFQEEVLAPKLEKLRHVP